MFGRDEVKNSRVYIKRPFTLRADTTHVMEWCSYRKFRQFNERRAGGATVEETPQKTLNNRNTTRWTNHMDYCNVVQARSRLLEFYLLGSLWWR